MKMGEESTQQASGLAAWRERYKFRVQVVALVLALLPPFGLYWALNAGHNGLAAGCFAAVAVGMGLIIWIS